MATAARIARLLFWIGVLAFILWVAQPLIAAVPDTTPTWSDLTTAVVVVLIAIAFGKLTLAVLRLVFPPREKGLTAAALDGTVAIGPGGLGSATKLALERLKTRARHEAAHAVVVRALGHRLMRVTTVPTAANAGHTAWQHREDAPASIDHVVVALAGPISESSATATIPGSLQDHHDDHAFALRQALSVSLADGEARTSAQVLDEATAAARRILSEHAEDVDRLAEALRGRPGGTTLSGCEVEQLLTGEPCRTRSTDENEKEDPA